jgi:hypothetical protein
MINECITYMCKDMYITFDINTFNNFGVDLA